MTVDAIRAILQRVFDGWIQCKRPAMLDAMAVAIHQKWERERRRRTKRGEGRGR